MPLTPTRVLTQLKKNNYSPVYFLQGDEPFYINQMIEYIEANALAEHEKSFNLQIFYGKDVDIATVLGSCRRFPMNSDRQVVIVKEAQEMGDWKKEKALEFLISYLKKPLPSTILVFGHKYKKLNANSKLFKTLDNHAVLVNSLKPKDYEIPDWIKEYVRETGHSITEKAVMLLSENLGNNLERINNEINKILVNYKSSVQIDEIIIHKYVGINRDYNAFELQNALIVRDVPKANKIVNYFGANPKDNPAILIIALLFGFFSKLLMVHHSRAGNEGAISKLLGYPTFVAKQYAIAARNYPIGKVIDNIHHIKKADLAIKGVDSGRITEASLLKELVFKLLH